MHGDAIAGMCVDMHTVRPVCVQQKHVGQVQKQQLGLMG